MALYLFINNFTLKLKAPKSLFIIIFLLLYNTLDERIFYYFYNKFLLFTYFRYICNLFRILYL